MNLISNIYLWFYCQGKKKQFAICLNTIWNEKRLVDSIPQNVYSYQIIIILLFVLVLDSPPSLMGGCSWLICNRELGSDHDNNCKNIKNQWFYELKQWLCNLFVYISHFGTFLFLLFPNINMKWPNVKLHEGEKTKDSLYVFSVNAHAVPIIWITEKLVNDLENCTPLLSDKASEYKGTKHRVYLLWD